MAKTISLSEAKAKLSELVRDVRNSGEALIITVNGRAAARLTPVVGAPRSLTRAEVKTWKALGRLLLELDDGGSFDAVELIGDGRR